MRFAKGIRKLNLRINILLHFRANLGTLADPLCL